MDNIPDNLSNMQNLVKERTEFPDNKTSNQYINVNKEILITEHPTYHKTINDTAKSR